MASAETRPVGDDEAIALFAALRDRRGLALAVSGGADSTALLHLYARARARDPALPPAVVLTVDHRLRPESAAECAAVVARAEALGLPARILVWAGPRPTSGLPAAARAARRALLLDAARAAGCDTLALAHHADDQAETFLARLARGSGVLGLAAMAKERREGDVLLVRPLLDLPKTRLVATLEAAGLAWVEDPSNRDPRFDRARLRAAAPALAALGLDRDRLVATARAMARAANALEPVVAARLATAVATHPAGWAVLELSGHADQPEEIRLRLLARLIAAVAGIPYAPRLDALERLDADLLAPAGPTPRVATLAGLRLERRRDRLWLAPEIGRAPTLALVPGATATWYGRSVAVAADAPAGLTLAPLGPHDRRRLADDRTVVTLAGTRPSAAVLASAPTLRAPDGALLCPALALADAGGERLASRVRIADFALPDAPAGGSR